ncbi:MAG: hypothetical protein JXA54_05645 [Candidatus Heimdallarchaeota archaeon]|nr:hypothetical protein [Candidatus Heimdallarchaeota archaeon]
MKVKVKSVNWRLIVLLVSIFIINFLELPFNSSVILYYSSSKQIEQSPFTTLSTSSINHTYAITSSLWTDTTYRVNDICFNDNFAYIMRESSSSYHDDDLYVVDFSNPLTPIITDTFSGFSNPYNMLYFNDYLIIPDSFLLWIFDVSNPYLNDTDFDGLIDGLEVNKYSTNPLNSDSDSDGYLDGDEINNGWDPNNPYSPSGLTIDTDQDGLTNAEEFYLGTDIYNPDTDFDTLSDGDEVNIYYTNPLEEDSDFDNLLDNEEVLIYHSDPWLVDTDSDNIDDYDEAKVYFTNPVLTDSDGDSFSDYDEIFLYQTNPNKRFSNPQAQFFVQKRLPIILAIITFLGLISFLTVVLKSHYLKIKSQKLISSLKTLLPNQIHGFFKSNKISFFTYMDNENQINTLSNFLFNFYLQNDKFPSKDQVSQFISERNYSFDLLPITIAIMTSNFSIDYSQIEVEDLISLNNLSFTCIQSIPYKNLSHKEFNILPLIFPQVNNSLVDSVIIYHFLKDCSQLKVSLDSLKDESFLSFNFEEAGCYVLRYLWSKQDTKEFSSVTYLHLMKYLKLDPLNTLTLLNYLLSLDYVKLASKLTEEPLKIKPKSKIGFVHITSILETTSELILDYWKTNRKLELFFGELAQELHLSNLKILYESYLLFIQNLILEEIELFANGQEVALIYEQKTISTIIDQSKKIFDENSFVMKAQRFLSSFENIKEQEIIPDKMKEEQVS